MISFLLAIVVTGSTVHRTVFENPNKGLPFEKMVIDPSTTRLYVGGVDHLYDLQSHDLSIRVHATIGPHLDSPYCGSEGDCQRTRTHAFVKALAIYKSSKLIECNSLFQGECRLRNLHNINESLAESGPILANDHNSSAVVLVGSGPWNDSVLYVASTHVSGPPLRDDIPSLSTRTLSKSPNKKEFELVVSRVGGKSAVFMERQSREIYPIEYVGAFEYGRFVYFATRQGRSLHEKLIESKLVRVCTGDEFFYSYTEVPLRCETNDARFNLLRDVTIGTAGYNLAKQLGVVGETDPLVYAVFEEGSKGSAHHQVATGRSALCVYKMKHIEQVFMKNILECYINGTDVRLPWFTKHATQKCKRTAFDWPALECGQDVNTRIGGAHPIRSEPLLVFDDRITSIATNTTHSSTVVFMGTSDGVLLKAVLEETHNVYERVQFANEPILADIEFSVDGKFIYALTPNEVIRAPSSSCTVNAPSCAACMAKGDPHCGWCIRSSTCTVHDECERTLPHSNNGWLAYNSSQCPSIRSVFPDKVQVSTSDFLNVTLENISSTKRGRLECVFIFPNGLSLRSEATKQDDNSVRCATPNVGRIPRMPPSDSSMAVSLAIAQSDQSLPPLASTTFTFFDCGRFSSCSDCTSSPFPCDWCLRSNECVSGQQTEDTCRNEVFVNGMSRAGTSSRRGPSHCPHIFVSSTLIYIPAGDKRAVSVKARNVDTVYMNDWKCRFRLEGGIVHEKTASRTHNGDIECDQMMFDKTGKVAVDVLWFSSDNTVEHLLDNTQGIALEVYRCEEVASDCGTCLQLDSSKYSCGWCMPPGAPSDSRCVGPRQCPTKTPWLNSSQLCANPVIRSFTPKKGPLGGNTLLQIKGSNLGRSWQDVKRIMVANVECQHVSSEFEAPSTIVCATGKASRQSDNRLPHGQVIVTLKGDDVAAYTGISADHFYYVDPKVHDVQPASGPRHGGTDIRLIGHDLDAGSDVKVFVGTQACVISERSDNTLICRTPPAENKFTLAPDPKNLAVTMTIDGYNVAMPGVYFEYLANPSVDRIDPRKSIVSGGITLDVVGSGFKLLQRPRIVIVGKKNDSSMGSSCMIRSDTHMLCTTPHLPHSFNASIHPTAVSFFVQLDGMPSDVSELLVFGDPEMREFAERRYYRPGENYLTINGEELNKAASERDVNVTVGGAPCGQVVLADRVLTCRPPETRPVLPNGLEPEVMVKIGGKLFNVGILSYDPPGMDSSMIAVIAVFLIAITCLFLFLLILYKRKSNSHARQMKLLKSKMDAIEMRVATECKEAFAELQTSLNAYTADLPLGAPAVPFLEYREYASRVLFPNNLNHPALRLLEVDSSRASAIESGLKEFHKLLMNKTFLLTMVRTMENNKYFVGKDRVYFGSLLMVVLQEKLPYCTDILKQLLKELIEKTVEKKFQPKILFRRSESVAERMLAAWFTFLMHNYLTECAGKKLYDLYWGIKQQMEKGPQDAITLEARYSLSEEKLLRATFDFRELTIFLAGDPIGFANPEIPVRVLDCDTITQVKEKCLEARYRTIPYSERPHAQDLDIEYRSPTQGRIILQDIDLSSRTEPGGWKRLNTLAHYKIPNNCMLTLAARQSSLYNLSLLSERSEKSSLSLKQSPTLSRPFGTSSSHSKDTDSSKLYHLVKPSEHGPSDQQEKMVTEIYLTRLLMMKGTLQKFINDLLEVIFSSSVHARLPACVKYMFDFMDGQALEHGIVDPEVTHAWKSNALPLRFWVNLIKNPHFVFDIPKPTKVEGCLSVVAQTLMDACSTQDHLLTKDSPSSKLLFAKDMFQYRDWVDSYYSDVAKMPPISEQDMNAMLNEESKIHRNQLQVYPALNELFKYLEQYKDAVMEALEDSEHAQAYQLPARLQDLLAIMESQRSSDYDSNTLGLGYNSNSRLMPRDRL